MTFVKTFLASWLAGLLAFLGYWLALGARLASLTDLGAMAAFSAVVLALTGLVFFVPLTTALRKAGAPQGSYALLGALLSVVPLVVMGLLFEGFEAGLASFLSSAETAAWAIFYGVSGLVAGMMVGNRKSAAPLPDDSPEGEPRACRTITAPEVGDLPEHS